MNIAYIEGDSTTFGMLDLEMGGWPNRLHVATLREDTSIQDMTMVVNRATPGGTLSMILRGVAANLAYYRSFGPVAAVLQTGMNEAKIHRGWATPIIPPERFGAQIVQFCTIAKDNDCAPILVGPPPIDTSRDNPTYGGVTIKDEVLDEYGGIMRGVAHRAGIPYVDTRAVFKGTSQPLEELLAPDGYHPNALGHAALAAAVYDALPFTNR